MRNVNLAHGSLYLFGAYVGYEVAEPDRLLAARRRRRLPVRWRWSACCCRSLVFRRMEGDELRQTLVTIGISIVAADLMLAVWARQHLPVQHPGLARRRGDRCRSSPPCAPTARRSIRPIRSTAWSCWRRRSSSASALWLMLNRTRIGMMIRAGVDDRAMLSARGVNVACRLRHRLCRSAPGSPALPASSAARRCRSRPARTSAICWPRWSW